MEPLHSLPALWHFSAWLALVPLLGWGLLRAPWSRLRVNEQSHVLLGAIVAITLLWTIGGRVGPAVHFHLLGATVLYLMFDLPLALVGMSLVVAATQVAAGGDWIAVADRALVAGALPVCVSHVVRRAAEARLPANFFIYVFVVAFLGGGVAMLGTVAAVAAAFALAGPAAGSPGDAWPALGLMLALGEATLTGMLMTLFVVYKPAWVGTFDDARYLRRRQP
jgi:uncharacterized membrane protein